MTTTRRGFLGFLAAAPAALPAVAKEAGKGFASGGYVRGGVMPPVGERPSAAIWPTPIKRKPVDTLTLQIDTSQITQAIEELNMTIEDRLIERFGAAAKGKVVPELALADSPPLEPGFSMQDGKLVHDGITRASLWSASVPLAPTLPDQAPTHWVQVLHDEPRHRAFDLMNPDPAGIDFDAMAITMSRLPRFGAQTKDGEAIYSVLQHSVEGCYAILRDTGNRKAAAAFLIHDHHEAIIGDQVTPVQRALQAHAVLVTGDLHAGDIVRDAYASLRQVIDAAIYKAAGLEWPLDSETRRIVKEYDLRMCRTERDARMEEKPYPWHPSIEDAEPVKGCIVTPEPGNWYMVAFKTLGRDLLPALGGHL